MYKHADVVDAVRRKQIRETCECCGRNDWLIPTKEDTPDQTLVLSMLVGTGINSVVSFVPMICSHCGNTRMLHANTLVEPSA